MNQSAGFLSSVMRFIKRGGATLGIVSAVIAGAISGFFFGKSMVIVAWMGDLFLNLLKMMVLPLVIVSIIAGIAKLGDIRRMGMMGVKTFLYYLTTTAIAVVIGLLLSNMIAFGPDLPVIQSAASSAPLKQGTLNITDFLLSMVPANIVKAMEELQLLPVILFSLFFGATLTTMGDKAAPLVEILILLEKVFMRMVRVIFWIAPLGIFGLIAGKLGETGGGPALLEKLWSLRWYAGDVILGLFLHSVVVLPLLLLILGRRNPIRYVSGMMPALLTAFSTASSSATLPVTMECAEDKMGISPRISSFVLPLGSTVNMDGTALYEAVAAMFIAHMYHIHLSPTHQIVVFLMSTVAAIGAAGIPEAGLVTMVMVLQAVHLPVEGIAFLLAIDWFLDRIRTTVNVWGDAVGAAVIQNSVRGE